MTRFIYIADTHMGANPPGYQQQKAYPAKLSEILAALKKYMRANGPVDFVLHGGDMIHVTTDDNIAAAVAAFDLPVPVYLCLGNHDLTVPDALDRWMTIAPHFFGRNGSPEYTIVTEECIVHVVPNHWEDRPYYWGDIMDAHLSKQQIANLKEGLNRAPHLPNIISTHSPVHGLPIEQTGLSEPHHAPKESFTSSITDLVAMCPSALCVLGAHNHMNMHIAHEEIEFVTVSSLVETPFEFKLFEVSSGSMTMSTLSLSDSMGFRGEYDAAKSLVQGRTVDRSFSRTIDRPSPQP